VFGIKGRAETNLTDEEYRQLRAQLFKLKWRWFVFDLLLCWGGALAIFFLLSGVVWLAALAQHKHFPWNKILIVALIVPPMAATICAGAIFLFSSPFDGLRKADTSDKPDN
jgi:hypothetical protein